MKFYFLLFFVFNTVTAMDVVEGIYTPPPSQQQIVRLCQVLPPAWGSKFALETALDYDREKKNFHIYRYGQLINTLHGSHLRTWKLTDDNNYLVMVSGRIIQIFNWAANEMVHSVIDETRNLTDVCYSPKNNLLIACHDKGILDIWKLGLREEFKHFKHRHLCNNTTLRALALSRDENTLAVGSAENSIKLFELSGEEPKKITNRIVFSKGLRGGISSLAWNDNGRLLAVGDSAGTVTVINKEDCTTICTNNIHNETITGLRFETMSNGLVKLISYSPTQRHETISNGLQ